MVAFYFDMTACIGCKACQMACKDKNNLPLGVLYREVKSYEVGEYPMPGIYHTSLTCNHCVDPTCIGIRKDGGLPQCVAACPMRALDFGTVEEIMERHPDAVGIDTMPFMPESDTHPATFVSPKTIVSMDAKLKNF